jgi:PPOX class probable F420-dependent enzyme
VTSTLDPSTPEGAWALTALERDVVAWLTTINPDGQPQSSPIWFLWADGEVRFYSYKRAARNGNIADRPLVSFNLNTDPTGESYVTMEGTARIDPDAPPASADTAFLAKYRAQFEEHGWAPEHYSGDYPVVVRITPTRWRL